MSIKMDDLTCIICLKIFKKPYVDTCGHSFCHKCILEWYKTKAICPISKSNCDKALVKNYALTEILDGIVFHCENAKNGCSWKGKPRAYGPKHKPKCLFKAYTQTIVNMLKDKELRQHLNSKSLPIDQTTTFEGFVDENGEFKFGIIIKEGSVVYEGNFKNSLKDGVGKHYGPDGERAEAEFAADRLHGYGIIYRGDETIYEGEFSRGVKEGRGKFFLPDGKIIATFKDDKILGIAKLVYKNKNLFKGSFEGVQPKSGELIYHTDKRKYTGPFVNGQPEGEGQLIWKNNEVYKGDFRRGQMEGHGLLVFANKTRYEGEFLDGKREGQGTFYYTNGRKYIGAFKNNAFHGKGTLVDQTGNRIEGEFVNGVLTNPAIKIFTDGNLYEGAISDDKMEGQGKMTYKNGEIYIGAWRNNMRHGTGKLIFPNGDVFEGNFKDNVREGKGAFLYNNGDKFEGAYERDKAHGKGAITFSEGGVLEGEWKLDLLDGMSKFRQTNTAAPKQIEWKSGVKISESFLPPPTAKGLKRNDQVASQKGLALQNSLVDNKRASEREVPYPKIAKLDRKRNIH